MTTANPLPITVVHSTALLESPQFGARALALLAEGEAVHSSANVDGFLRIQRGDGPAGYVPSALCASQAHSPPLHTRVVQPVLLYGHPTPGTQLSAPWIVSPNELLQVLGYSSQFVNVKRPNGQVGHIPTALIVAWPIAVGHTTQVRQPTHLYHSPAFGDHFFATAGMVVPEEALLRLGTDGRFTLIQRDDGQLGYVPTVLCGAETTGAILNTGPLDLGWLALGGGWCWVNWVGIVGGLNGLQLIDAALKPYLGLALVLGAAAALWFSPRRRIARSLALGVLLAYALLHLISGGTLTMWR